MKRPIAIGGLAFFVRCSGQSCWNIVSFHSRSSLTWSWILSFSLFRGDEWRVWPLGWKHRNNNGLQWGFRIPWIGIVHWHRQQPMYYADIWRSERDERDRLEYEASCERAREREAEQAFCVPPPADPGARALH